MTRAITQGRRFQIKGKVIGDGKSARNHHRRLAVTPAEAPLAQVRRGLDGNFRADDRLGLQGTGKEAAAHGPRQGHDTNYHRAKPLIGSELMRGIDRRYGGITVFKRSLAQQ